MVERVQALESGIWVWTLVLLFNSSLPLGKSFNFWASCCFIKIGSIPTHQKTIVRTKCESTTYCKVEHMIVTYLCQFCFPSRGRHKGTCFICLFNVLWIWRFGLPEVYLWISTCIYREFSLGGGPPKNGLKSGRVWPFSSVHSSPGSQKKVPGRNAPLSPEE